MDEARPIIMQWKRCSIRGKSNDVIESIGDVCFKDVNNADKIQRRRYQNRKQRGRQNHGSTSQKGIPSHLNLQRYVFRLSPSTYRFSFARSDFIKRVFLLRRHYFLRGINTHFKNTTWIMLEEYWRMFDGRMSAHDVGRLKFAE